MNNIDKTKTPLFRDRNLRICFAYRAAIALFMFIFMGVAPMSSALTGLLLRSLTLPQLFAGCGTLLVAIVVLTYALSGMRHVADLRSAPQ
jgi:hypothetical protein